MWKQDEEPLAALEQLVTNILAFMLIFLETMLGLVQALVAIDMGEL